MIFLPHYMWTEHKTSHKYANFVYFGEEEFYIIDRIHTQFEKEQFEKEEKSNTKCHGLDFVNFLVEKYGNEGPSSRRLIKPESVRLTMLSYRSTFNLSMKGRQKTQTWLDFCKMPTVDQFREDKA